MISNFFNLKGFNRFRALAMCLTGACALLLSHAIQANIDNQRKLFQDASYALNTGQISKFNRLFKQLEGYPVRAYLTFDAFNNRISRVTNAEMTQCCLTTDSANGQRLSPITAVSTQSTTFSIILSALVKD